MLEHFVRVSWHFLRSFCTCCGTGCGQEVYPPSGVCQGGALSLALLALLSSPLNPFQGQASEPLVVLHADDLLLCRKVVTGMRAFVVGSRLPPFFFF